jgi:hypothetical protein
MNGKKRQGKRLFSAIHSLLLLSVCYALWNSPYTFSSEPEFIRWFNFGKRLIAGNDTLPGNLLLIDIAYDRALVPLFDERGVPAGQIDITDREKLLQLFRRIAEENNHKYIICDLFFDSSLTTSHDDALFELMAQIPRLVVPVHDNGKTLFAPLSHKAAYADYKVNIVEGSLLKYQYLQDGQMSLPLFMWTELTGGRFEQSFPLYFMNGSLATNSVILDFKTLPPGAYEDDGTKNILNLGADILEMFRETSVTNFFKDKIILIGDLSEHDIHDTTAGQMPGILINYNAWQMLEDGKPVVPAGLLLLLFAVFAVMSHLTVSHRNFFDAIPRKGIFKHDVVWCIVTWLGFSFTLTAINLLTYFIWGRFLEIFILSSYFTLMKTGFDFYNLFKQKR